MIPQGGETEEHSAPAQRPEPMRGVHPQRTKKRLVSAGTKEAHPNFTYHGGPIINTPRLHALYVGDWAGSANQSRASRLSQFLTEFLQSTYMNILSQYGCGSSG